MITQDNLITGQKKIGDRITTYGEVMASADIEIHTIACSILNHVINHREKSLVDKLIDQLGGATGKSQRLNALKQWFVDFGPLEFHQVDKTAPIRIVFSKKKTVYKGLEEALKTPFWSYIPEAPIRDFAFEAKVKSLYNQVMKRVKLAGEDKAVGRATKISDKQVKALTDFCKQVGVEV